MLLEFIRVCASAFPKFEFKVTTTGNESFIVKHLIEHNPTQMVALVAPVEGPGEARVIGIAFSSIAIIELPPEWEKKYLKIVQRMDALVPQMAKPDKNWPMPKTCTASLEKAELYEIFYTVVRSHEGFQILNS